MVWRKKSASRKRYRKRYTRKRAWRKRRIPRLVYREAETKVLKTQLTYTCLNDRLASTQPLGLIIRGTGQNERIGESIRLQGIKCVWAFENNTSVVNPVRLRIMAVVGGAWAAGSALLANLTATTEDQCFDKIAPRNGSEIWNSDMGKVMTSREVVFRGQMVPWVIANNAQPTTNAVTNEMTDTGRRYSMWVPCRNRLVKWRDATSLFQFTVSQPNIVVYTNSPGRVYGATLGTLYLTIHLYYKDM